MVAKKAGGGMTPKEEQELKVWREAGVIADQLKRLPNGAGNILWGPNTDFTQPELVILVDTFADTDDMAKQLANMGITNRTTTIQSKTWGEVLAVNINDINRARLAELASSPSGPNSTFIAADSPAASGVRSIIADFLVSAANRIRGHAAAPVKSAGPVLQP